MKLQRKHRNIGIIVLVIVFLLLFFHSTERLATPYMAMPETSVIASDHTDLRGRWRDFVLIPTVSNALAAADVDVMEFRNEPGWRILIPLTTGENTVLAFTPTYGNDGNPVLWGASFAGWRKRILQFMLVTRWIPGLGRLELAPNGSKYLQLGSKRHPSEWKVGFAMRQNVLLAALSTDGDAVRQLEMRLDGKGETAEVFGTDAPWKGSKRDLHRFWIRPPFVKEHLNEPVEVAIEKLQPGQFRFRTSVAISKDFADGLANQKLSFKNTKASVLAADSAFILAMFPRETVAKYLNELFYPNGNVPPPKHEEDEDAVIYLNSSPYNGSLLGIKIPAVTVLCPGIVISRDNILTAMNTINNGDKYPQVLEGINEKHKMLVPIKWFANKAIWKLYDSEYGIVELNRISHGFTFCSARKSYEAQLPAAGHPGISMRDEWIKTNTCDPGNNSPVGFLWIDIDPVAYEVRQLLALARLATVTGIVKFSSDETKAFDAVRNFLANYSLTGKIASLAFYDNAAPNRLSVVSEFISETK